MNIEQNKMDELVKACKSWLYHQDKWGGKHYHNVIEEQEEKHQARNNLIQAIKNLGEGEVRDLQ